MAYNPFNVFRRNQKAIFAVVTVFIMFTFVLSSGLRGARTSSTGCRAGSPAIASRATCSVPSTGTRSIQASWRSSASRPGVMANRFMSLAGMQTAISLDNIINER